MRRIARRPPSAGVRVVHAALFAWLVGGALAGSPASSQAAPPQDGRIIDRILAVVAGNVLTLTDVQAAIGLGLVDVAGSGDPIAAGLEGSIERALMLIEVERYAPPEPPADAIDARLAQLRNRFASPEQLDAALAAWGLTGERLRAIARDDLRLQAYLDQRFATGAAIQDDEVFAYYREHADRFTRDGTPLPLSDVEPEVRRALARERREALLVEWTRGLRRRADVTVLYLPR